jgi:diphthine synthase
MLILFVVCSVYNEDSLCVGVARVGQANQQIVSGRMKDLLYTDFGAPLHSFVIAGTMHILEKEVFDSFSVKESSTNNNNNQ